MSDPSSLVIVLIITALIIVICICRNWILPWCRTAKRRRIWSKKKYNKLTTDTSKSKVATFDAEDEDDITGDQNNQMMLKRVEYTSRELEQLQLLDAALNDDDMLDSSSLNFPENDNMDITDNDEYHSLDETTNSVLKTVNNDNNTKINSNNPNQLQKSIFENDTDDNSSTLITKSVSLNVVQTNTKINTNTNTSTSTSTNTISNDNNNGEDIDNDNNDNDTTIKISDKDKLKKND